MKQKKKPPSSSEPFYLEPEHILWFFENYPWEAAKSVYQEITRIMEDKRNGTLGKKYGSSIDWHVRPVPGGIEIGAAPDEGLEEENHTKNHNPKPEPGRSTVSKEGQLKALARQLKNVFPLAEEVLMEFDAEDRRRLRDLTGHGFIFKLSNIFNALCGEDARQIMLEGRRPADGILLIHHKRKPQKSHNRKPEPQKKTV